MNLACYACKRESPSDWHLAYTGWQEENIKGKPRLFCPKCRPYAWKFEGPLCPQCASSEIGTMDEQQLGYNFVVTEYRCRSCKHEWTHRHKLIEENPRRNMKLYHVTDRRNIPSIKKRGFKAGYGDCGDGIYFWSDKEKAEDDYMDGGWDGRIKQPAILVVETDESIPCIIRPEWKSERDKYEAIRYIPLKIGTFKRIPFSLWGEVERNPEVFSRTSTDMPLFDNMLEKPEYFREEKGVQFQIVDLTPDEYMKFCAMGKGHLPSGCAEDDIGVDGYLVERYAQDMRRGDIFPMPMLEYKYSDFSERIIFSQEGRHRALAAKMIGLKTIPVLIVYPVFPEELQLFRRRFGYVWCKLRE